MIIEKRQGLIHLFCLLVVCSCLAGFSCPVSAAIIASGGCGGFYYDTFSWTLDDLGTLNLTGTGEILGPEDGPIELKNLPESAKVEKLIIGEGITYIGEDAFYERSLHNILGGIKSLSLPSSLKDIVDGAFCEFSSLEEIVFREGLTRINCNAFTGCSKLKELILPDSLVYLEEESFSYCRSLSYVSLGKGLKSLDPSLFTDCHSLSEITIPPNIEKIYSNVFFACPIDSIVIPCTVTVMGEHCLGYRYDDNNTLVKNEDLVIYGAAGTAAEIYAVQNGFQFVDSPLAHSGKTDAEVKPTCTKDGKTQSVHCTYCNRTVAEVVPALGHDYVVKEITREPTETKKGILTYTCKRCGEEKTETIPVVKPLKSGNVFTDAETGCRYKVLKKKKCVSFLSSKKKAKKAIIPDTIRYKGITYKVTEISANALSNNTLLTSVSLGSNLTRIGAKAFFKCSKLKSVVIPANVSSIGKSAFKGCKNLKNITIQSKKMSSGKVGASAFAGTPKKTVVKVPAAKRTVYRKWLYKKGISRKATIK